MPSALPYQLVVANTQAITPNMQRVTLKGEDLADFPQGHEGGYVKLLFPIKGETQLPSAQAVEDGAKVIMRTYTVRRFDVTRLELDIDLVLHGQLGHSGPASTWAKQTQEGDTMLMYGPGKVKPINLQADWFLLAGDMTALPAISCQLESLPDDAKGHAIIEINHKDDEQHLIKPANLHITWIINSHPDQENTMLSDAVKSLPWLQGKPSIWAACEFSNMRLLRAYFKKEKQVNRDELYISSYWKMGQTEDKHKIIKKQDAQAEG